MKKFFAIAAAVLISVASFAQETNIDENGNKKFGGYETNKFWDNWFINVSPIGANFTLDVGYSPAIQAIGYAAQLDFGKWISPEYGARFGWRGLNNNVSGHEAFNFVKADFLLHLSNLGSGYKENRFWDVIPLAGFGVLIDKNAGFEYGFEAGIINNFKVTDAIDVNWEVGGNLAPGSRYGNYGMFVAFPYTTLGVAYNFGKSNWTRVSTTAAAAAAAIAAAKAAQEAAEAKVAGAQKTADEAQVAAKNAQNEAKQLVDEAKKAAGSNIDGLFDEPVVVYFQIGQSTLSKAEKAHAEYAIKNIIARGENVKFTLNGSADTGTGSKARNKQLSKQRAQTVYNLVDELGVSRENITVVEWDGTERFATPELNRAVIIEKQ